MEQYVPGNIVNSTFNLQNMNSIMFRQMTAVLLNISQLIKIEMAESISFLVNDFVSMGIIRGRQDNCKASGIHEILKKSFIL